MAFRLSRRTIPLIAAAAWAASCSQSSAAVCDRWAAPGGSDRADGSQSAPFKTAQRLANALGAGETGCLREGDYAAASNDPGYVLRIGRGGRDGRPLTIRSAPGERARLRGLVYVVEGAEHVELADFDLDGRRPRPGAEPDTSVKLMARFSRLQRLRITNARSKTCVLLGSNRGYGVADGTVIEESVFENCGDPDRGMLDHAVYVERASDVRIENNLFLGTAAYAVHLYPNARNTLVRGNVAHENGGGVIFAGDGDLASSGNVVEGNVFSRSRREPHIRSYWNEAVGRGNVARRNCLVDDGSELIGRERGFDASSNVVAPSAGFTAPSTRDFRVAGDSPCGEVAGEVLEGAVAPEAARRARAPEPASAQRRRRARRTSCSRARAKRTARCRARSRARAVARLRRS